MKGRWANKREGQHFLMDRSIAEIEAAYGEGRRVLEMGSGMGILTEALCKKAKSVISVEKDRGLFERLEYTLISDKLRLINKDFFELGDKEIGECDIMISNIPYKLSSKVVSWLGARSMPAVLCVQKEFAEHMTASPGSKSYSRLSVESELRFKVYKVRDVPPTCFHPMPHVDSAIVYLVPKKVKIAKRADEVITALMNHKKKTLRNALMDSCRTLGVGKEEMSEISAKVGEGSQRPLHMNPEEILEVAEIVAKRIRA
ncbi:MAG: ribosomal RNA small subunit methyltransferase A [Candidatus Micrarchaeota archaeon]|nr:ribosomal RNA small subunit methyltransferase A [Candidatus Micrarchaeota archaeon]